MRAAAEDAKLSAIRLLRSWQAAGSDHAGLLAAAIDYGRALGGPIGMLGGVVPPPSTYNGLLAIIQACDPRTPGSVRDRLWQELGLAVTNEPIRVPETPPPSVISNAASAAGSSSKRGRDVEAKDDGPSAKRVKSSKEILDELTAAAAAGTLSEARKKALSEKLAAIRARRRKD